MSLACSLTGIPMQWSGGDLVPTYLPLSTYLPEVQLGPVDSDNSRPSPPCIGLSGHAQPAGISILDCPRNIPEATRDCFDSAALTEPYKSHIYTKPSDRLSALLLDLPFSIQSCSIMSSETLLQKLRELSAVDCDTFDAQGELVTYSLFACAFRHGRWGYRKADPSRSQRQSHSTLDGSLGPCDAGQGFALWGIARVFNISTI